ncbi:MAG: MFS transporter [Pseudomonadota bacterium]
MSRPSLGGLRQMLAPRGHIYRGWWLVLASANVQLLGSMLWMQSYGAYVVLMEDEFGWSKTAFAGAFAFARLESGILGPVQGILVDRFGPRLILTIGMILFGVGFLFFSQVDTLLTFYLAFGLMALGSSLGGFATLMVSLVNWFSRYRSTAVAVSQMGYSFGGFCVPLLVIALEAFGWRTTALLSGILVLAVGIPLVQPIRHRPAEIGETVDGLPEAPAATVAGGGLSFTARQALATPAFWLISFGHAIALLAVAALLVHLIPHLTEQLDYSLEAAATAVATLTVFQVLGQMSGGFLGDRISKRLICSVCMLLHGAGLLVLAQASSTLDVAFFAALHGLAWGARGPQMIALRADYFGASAFGTILGFSSLIVMLGTMGGPVFVGYLADRSGSYATGFTGLAGVCVLGALCFALAAPPKLPIGTERARAGGASGRSG